MAVLDDIKSLCEEFTKEAKDNLKNIDFFTQKTASILYETSKRPAGGGGGSGGGGSGAAPGTSATRTLIDTFTGALQRGLKKVGSGALVFGQNILESTQLSRAAGSALGYGAKVGGLAMKAVGEQIESLEKSGAKAQNALYAMNNVFDTVMGSLGGAMAKFVQTANPGVVIQFNLALENAMSAMGRIFAPVLMRITVIIQMIGDAVESLNEESKGFIGSMAAGAGLVGAFGAILSAIGAVVAVSGGWVAAIAGIVGAIAGLIITGEDGRKAMALVGEMLQVTGSLFQQFVATIMPLLNAAINPMIAAFHGAVPLIQSFMGVFASIFNGLTAVIAPLLPIIGMFVQVMGSFFAVGNTILSLVFDLVGVLAGGLGTALTWVVGKFQVVADGFIYLFNLIISKLNWIKRQFGLDETVKGAAFNPTEKHAGAVRPAQFGDLRGAANRAYASTYNSTAMDPKLKAAEKTNTILEYIRNNLLHYLRKTGESSGTTPEGRGLVEAMSMWLR